MGDIPLNIQMTAKGLLVNAAIDAYEALVKQPDPQLVAKGEALRAAVEAMWAEDVARG